MKQKVTVRALEDADPNYSAAKELLQKLRAAMSKIDTEESELLYRISNRPLNAERSGRVAILLGESDPEAESAPDGASARLRAIAAERVDLRAAVEIARQRLTTARYAASAIVCEEVKADYASRVQAVAATLLAAHAAHSELLALIDDLTRADIAWTGPMPPMQAFNVFGHDGGRLSVWLYEATQAGFVDKKSIPTELAR